MLERMMYEEPLGPENVHWRSDRACRGVVYRRAGAAVWRNGSPDEIPRHAPAGFTLLLQEAIRLFQSGEPFVWIEGYT
jgi:hypothetical protein